MSVGADDMLTSVADSAASFWEIDGYRRTVRRVEDGLAECAELSRLIQDRADIERDYAKRLKLWAKKWNDNFDKGPEYGTTKATLKGVLDEAERLADVHAAVKTRLLADVQTTIKDWRNEHYKKQMVGDCKETKTFDDEFHKAQKPWSKRYVRMIKCKKDYYLACKQEKTAMNQDSNARNCSDTTPDQLRKLQDKVDKCRKEVQTTRERYKQSLAELTSYNAKYIEDMTDVYRRTQDFERQRLVFIKNILYQLSSCVDITQNKTLPQIYVQLRQTIDQADADVDLSWWTQQRGVDMPMTWPTYEEYTTEFHSITSRDTHRDVIASDSVRLTSLQKNDLLPLTSSDTCQSASTTSFHAASNSTSSAASASSLTTAVSSNDNTHVDSPGVSTRPLAAAAAAAEGVTVRALFDYEAQEPDELSFLAGERFVKLKDRDAQGWCTGCKDGRVGLYPDSYVEQL